MPNASPQKLAAPLQIVRVAVDDEPRQFAFVHRFLQIYGKDIHFEVEGR